MGRIRASASLNTIMALKWINGPRLVFMAVVIMGCWSKNAAEGIDDSRNSVEKHALACGPNSLYMFLILSGHSNVSLPLTHNIPSSFDGVSLATLRDIAGKLNIDVEIRRYRPKDIALVPLPAIVQFRSSPAAIGLHHFYVIYKVGPWRVDMLDGTTGLKESIKRSSLTDFWTGYAMSNKKSNNSWLANRFSLAGLLACVLLADLILIVGLARWLHGEDNSSSKRNTFITEVG